MIIHLNSDPRREGLLKGLRQLTVQQLLRVITYPGEMVLDEYNYHDGCFCPLAIGVGLDQTMRDPTDEKVFAALEGMGYSVRNTKGLKGEFYTNDRHRDLIVAAYQVVEEKYDDLVGGIVKAHRELAGGIKRKLPLRKMRKLIQEVLEDSLSLHGLHRSVPLFMGRSGPPG